MTVVGQAEVRVILAKKELLLERNVLKGFMEPFVR